LSAVGAFAASVSASRPGRVRAPFGWGFALVAGATAFAFAHSYAGLAPLAGSESPESLLLLIPPAAAYVLWRQLAAAPRDGGELAVNLFLAAPLLIVLVAVLLWFPSRLSYFYWVYRLDLLAVPLFVAFAVLLAFGLTALWRARWAIALLLLGWPPVLDSVLGSVAGRAGSMQAALLGLLPLPATRIGETFLVGRGPTRAAITLAAPCAGLLGVFSMLLVGGVVVAYRSGPRRRKLAWLATAVAIALLANVVRLALVVTVAAASGVEAGFALFHALAGPLLFALALMCALLLLDRFGLAPREGVIAPARPLELPRGTAAALVCTVGAAAALAAWSTSVGQTPGLFRGAIALEPGRLLPLPAGYASGGVSELASLRTLFGRGADAQLTHIDGVRGDAVAAQVVVTPSYGQALRYNVLDCFVFHHARVYATHVAPLVEGGTAVLTAVRLDGADVATATWVQPALIAGRRAWRRVLLFAYLDGASSRPHVRAVDSAQSFGSWLLDRFGPYGATIPPRRFRRVERGLVALSDLLVTGRGGGTV
jgi:exosortase/archaeosortase family protein